MNKTLIIMGIALTANVNVCYSKTFVTPGNGEAYDVTSLSECDNSLISKLGGEFLLTDTLIISSQDKLVDDNINLVFSQDALVKVLGEAEFQNCAFFNKPGNNGIGFILDDEGSIKISNSSIDGLGIACYGTGYLIVEDDEFKNVPSVVNSLGVISFVGNSRLHSIKDCVFADCEVPAIGTAANALVGMDIENSIFENCNSSNTNKPMLNLTTPGEYGPVTIKNCQVIGHMLNMVGGISVSNLISAPSGEVIIEGNTIRDCRYGINLMGPLSAQVRDNDILNNRYEANPMNGGSGISCTGFADGLDVIISGNWIEGNQWGVTLISYGLMYPAYYKGFKRISLGEPSNAAINSPGLNIFKSNGNDGNVYDPSVPYDLYNNSDQTVYAQNNSWSVENQTSDEIANVIFDKSDDSKLGEVIYMPAASEGNLSIVAEDSAIEVRGDVLFNPNNESISVFNTHGICVLSSSDKVMRLAELPKGMYFIKGLKLILK